LDGNDVDVSEGDAVAVSVKGSVTVACGEDVTKAVAVGACGVNSAVDGFTVPVGMEGEATLQAHKASINKMEKTKFLCIGIYIPFQNNVSE
jgi:hypothetical protein